MTEIESAADEMHGWLKLKMTTGAVSSGLVYQLAAHYHRLPQLFSMHGILIDVHAVLDEIGGLENADNARTTRTKPPTQFTSGPLKGLWHKHWFQASFLAMNLSREVEKNGDTLVYKFLNNEFGRDQWQGQTITEGLAGKLASVAVDGALNNRAGRTANKQSRLTGEWIIFAKTKGRNIFLTLAAHDEPGTTILSRCSAALTEFPELASVEPFATQRAGKI